MMQNDCESYIHQTKTKEMLNSISAFGSGQEEMPQSGDKVNFGNNQRAGDDTTRCKQVPKYVRLSLKTGYASLLMMVLRVFLRPFVFY